MLIWIPITQAKHTHTRKFLCIPKKTFVDTYHAYLGLTLLLFRNLIPRRPGRSRCSNGNRFDRLGSDVVVVVQMFACFQIVVFHCYYDISLRIMKSVVSKSRPCHQRAPLEDKNKNPHQTTDRNRMTEVQARTPPIWAGVGCLPFVLIGRLRSGESCRKIALSLMIRLLEFLSLSI